MKTNEFFVSLVFGGEMKTVKPVKYKKPITSEEPVEIFPHKLGGNAILIKNCTFTVHPSHNKEIMGYKEGENEEEITEHVVTDENAEYEITAYLSETEDQVLSNEISLISILPKGLVMNNLLMIDVFVFSNFSLMLFDKNHNFK